ncbi:flavin reductase family protein [Nocardia sp. CA-120079]|uniref:flavin reductase family protein n=1 Tax=Nocardia sp. CA-120079 TaxID=3239974 RepID=UPI003D98F4D0
MHVTRNQMDEAVLRNAFAAFPSGVTVVAGLIGDTPAGLTASSFTSVSLNPPLVSVCVAHTSTTWPVLRGVSHFGVSVLSYHQADLAREVASRSAADRFNGVRWRSTEHGAVFLDGAALWLECSLHDQLPAGDHDVALLEIHELKTFDRKRPLVFHRSRFHQIVPWTPWPDNDFG